LAEKKSRPSYDLWEEARKRMVDDWEPTSQDINWLVTVVAKMNVGGKWVVPATGATFEKVGQDHLRLESIVTDDVMNALIMVEKTKKVGERAAIRIDIEKAADYIIFHP
jgi:hypothetical protein